MERTKSALNDLSATAGQVIGGNVVRAIVTMCSVTWGVALDIDAGQAGTAIERLVTNAGDALGDHHAGQAVLDDSAALSKPAVNARASGRGQLLLLLTGSHQAIQRVDFGGWHSFAVRR